MWFRVVCNLIDNDTSHHIGQNLLWSHVLFRLMDKICSPAIITSPEVIIEEYDAILGQWEREDLYNHLSNYTNEQLDYESEFSTSR